MKNEEIKKNEWIKRIRWGETVWRRKNWNCMKKEKMKLYEEGKNETVWRRKKWNCMKKEKMKNEEIKKMNE